MLPKWFNEWNRENPTNIFGPAILVGALGGAVVLAILLVTWGQPFATTSLQTGPRGTGMSVPEFAVQVVEADPTIEAYYTEEPYIPEGGETLARDAYENVQVLGDLTEDNFNRLMNAMTQWVSPDEGCAYCHGEEGDFASDDLYTKVVSRRMIQMTQNINENWDGHVNGVAEVGVNCYTCHRGQHVPSDIWFNVSPVTEATSGWASVQNRATSMSVSTSLPSNALETYLTDPDSLVNVHDLESRVKGVPGLTEDVASLQKTEQTFALMNYFANSLGVNCVFCHNSRAFYEGSENTPQWGLASLGRQMVIEINNEYLIPLKDTYPEERLGPIFGDAPKAACRTCHKGYQRPMQGLNVIADWPELASTEAPDYPGAPEPAAEAETEEAAEPAEEASTAESNETDDTATDAGTDTESSTGATTGTDTGGTTGTDSGAATGSTPATESGSSTGTATGTDAATTGTTTDTTTSTDGTAPADGGTGTTADNN